MGKVDFGKILAKIEKGLQLICRNPLILLIGRQSPEPRTS